MRNKAGNKAVHGEAGPPPAGFACNGGEAGLGKIRGDGEVSLDWGHVVKVGHGLDRGLERWQQESRFAYAIVFGLHAAHTFQTGERCFATAGDVGVDAESRGVTGTFVQVILRRRLLSYKRLKRVRDQVASVRINE